MYIFAFEIKQIEAYFFIFGFKNTRITDHLLEK